MQSVQKISFKSNSLNSNLKLANIKKDSTATTYPTSQNKNNSEENPILAQQTKEDSFSNGNKVKSFLKENGGIIAIITSIITIPTAIIAAKKSSTKIADKVQNDISEKIEQAVQTALSNATPSTEKMVPPKARLTTILLGMGTGFGISEFIKNNRERLLQSGFSEREINDATKDATEIVDAQKNLNGQLNELNSKAQDAIIMARDARNSASEARSRATNAENTANDTSERMHRVQDSINIASDKANRALAITEGGLNPIMETYTVKHYDLNLLQVVNYPKKIDLTRSDEALESIRNAAIIRNKRSAKDTVSDIIAYKERFPQLESLWCLTAEYAPIKTGGLGVVPVDLQNNFTKLGIDAPTFIPMYLKKNQAEFRKLPGNKYEYKYNGQKFNLTKIASTTTHVYRNGITKPEQIEYYMTELNIEGSQDKKKQLIFVKSSNYFNENIYDSTTNAEETERFTLFTKAVYKLAKLKVNLALNNNEKAMSGISDMEICDEEAFNKLKAPNSMILNDWHAGSMAGLLRYRAPMEYNYKEIPKNTYTALKDMPLLMIGHNLGCQGKSNDGSGSLLSKNKVTENIINTLYDSYAIAITENAHSGIMGENDDMCNTVLMKRSTADKHFNHLFNGVALSDWFVPVSKNYANEIIIDPMKSGILYPLLNIRKNTGTISGIVNGLDKDKVDMNAVSTKNFVNGLVLEKYDKNTDINTVMQLRKENKRRFYHAYIKPILIDKNYSNGPEVVRPDAGNMNISEQDFMEAPLISFAHRLTSQKGLGILKGAIFRLFDNWEKEFPNKPMPYFLVGGPSESAEELKHLDDLKNPDYGTNKARVDHVIALKGNLPNPAIMSASAFFCAPSTYEPCGLIQGECFAKGTPVIVTNTGGFKDTVKDGITGFIAPEISEESFYEKLVEALKMYYEKPNSYKKMVQNDLKQDFSWAQSGKKGALFEYTDKFGFDRNNLIDIAIQDTI